MAAPSMTPKHEEDVYEDDPRYDDADISTIPFVQQPADGRGLWKNPISFVSAARELPPQTTGSTNGRTMAEKYLAIMFPNGQPQPKLEAYPLCGICGEPVKETDQRIHYLSPTHQAALPRAPIPSAIDRTRMGLKYMEDKFVLGIDKKEHTKKRALGGASVADVKEGKLDAGKVRKLATVEKKKHERLQRMFYGNDEVEKYLGELDG